MGDLDDRILGSGATGGDPGGLGDLLGGLAGGGGGGDLAGILGKLTGGEGGGLGGLLTQLVPVVGGMLAGGGLQKVLAQLETNGLGSQAASWIGTGPNEPISGTDVEKAIGHDEIAGIASKLGISESDAAAAVAEALPAVVDAVSPQGELPAPAELDSALSSLERSSPPSS
jgi:uncharacterized protein YidB (DUF937 family)